MPITVSCDEDVGEVREDEVEELVIDQGERKEHSSLYYLPQTLLPPGFIVDAAGKIHSSVGK